MIIDIILAFSYGFLIDLAYVCYIKATQKNYAFYAASASVAMAAPSMLGILSAINNHWMTIPYFVGLFLGTFVALKRSEKRQASLTEKYKQALQEILDRTVPGSTSSSYAAQDIAKRGLMS